MSRIKVNYEWIVNQLDGEDIVDVNGFDRRGGAPRPGGTMSTPAKFTEGTIYALHTGYCMQETRFYQVTGFTKSAKSAIVRQLERYYVPDKPGFVITYKDHFSGPARTIRICLDRDGSENIRVGFQDYLWATRPWNGEAGSRDYSINFEQEAP